MRKLPQFMTRLALIASSCFCLCANAGPVDDLAARLLSEEGAKGFVFGDLPASQNDVFEISAANGKIIIKGNSELSKATGLNYYLEHYCNSSVSLNYNQISLPASLPQPAETLRVETPFEYRYFFNYCTFGYTMPWWGWDKWEKMTDYMALKGVNMPLAIIGQESVWQKVYKEMGLSQEEIDAFLVGPAHLPWGWMGNIDGMGGVLPQAWISQREDLQKKVLERQRSFGMKPVLPAFTGHVPPSLKNKYPDSKIMQIEPWAGIPGTYFLDPNDPLFTEIGTNFIKAQTEMYGTDHLYSADCFIEVNPPSNDPDFLESTAKTVYESMAKADEKAVWVLQGWFFFFKSDFWHKEQGRAFYKGIPKDKVVTLDLYGEKNPVWDKTDAFFGQPWIWNVICNEDQKTNMSGDLKVMQKEFDRACESELGKNLRGIGVIPEGIGYNPIIMDFIFNKAWDLSPTNVDEWVSKYAQRRYNTQNPHALKAWAGFLNTVYGRTRTMWSPLITTPQMTHFSGKKEDIRHVRAEINVEEDPFAWDFDVYELKKAVDELIACSGELKDQKTYQFDLTHSMRELLHSLTHRYITDLTIAYDSKDIEAFDAATAAIAKLFDDLDEITGCNENFMLGTWLNEAMAWGGDDKDARQYYNTNARTILTIWQPYEEASLRDYAGRTWNGLFKDYYKPRWALYCGMLRESLANKSEFDRGAYDKAVRKMDYQWTLQDKVYPDQPTGDISEVAPRIIKDYEEIFTKKK